MAVASSTRLSLFLASRNYRPSSQSVHIILLQYSNFCQDSVNLTKNCVGWALTPDESFRERNFLLDQLIIQQLFERWQKECLVQNKHKEVWYPSSFNYTFLKTTQSRQANKHNAPQKPRVPERGVKTAPGNAATHQFCISELCFRAGPVISGLRDSQHAKDQEPKLGLNLRLFLGIQFSTSGNSSITGEKSKYGHQVSEEEHSLEYVFSVRSQAGLMH